MASRPPAVALGFSKAGARSSPGGWACVAARSGASPKATLHDALGARIDVESAVANEAEQRDARRPREFDGQARGGAHGGHDEHARHRRLLQELEAGPPAQEKDP